MQAGKFVAATEISERQAEGLYPCFGGNGLRGYTKTFNQSGRYSLIGRQGALCGNVNLAEGNFYATEHAVVTTPKPGNSTDWLFYNLCLLNLNRFATGQAQPGLSIDVLEKVSCATPKDEKEQQKIANCLASIDERITLEAQKLDTLKTHKKGLMQQLFPAEGETLPKLRFPEFRDAGEWEEHQFGKLIKVNSGKGFKASEYCKHGVRLLQIENVGYGVTKWNGETICLPQNYSTEYPELVLREGDIVLALNRPVTNDELKIAQLQKEDEPSLLYQRVGKFELLSESVVGDFVFHICRIFIKDFVVKRSIGSDQPFISVTTLYAQTILIPLPDEQQKIANCLDSLDDLITAQTQKLAALKTHKKGLMQQLFPALDEVAA
jgi:type I restriction enzyme S subunit